MGKIAFVFPGQGAQRPGMGYTLFQHNSAARALFDEIDRLRPGTSNLCFFGTEEALGETQNTQPCLFACELAAARALQSAGVRPDMAAGFSLGEIAALTIAGSVSLASGFELVTRRGELMQADAQKAAGAMVAVIKLDAGTVDALCREFDRAYPVNYNCPGQTGVACLKSELPAFADAVRAAGGRAIPLKVGAGFHSPFFREASRGFALALQQHLIAPPAIPLYSNYTGLPYEKDYALLLSRQICNPVRWETIVQNMIAEGADTFFEAGPGRVLSGMIKKIDPKVRTFCIEEYADLESAVKECRPC